MKFTTDNQIKDFMSAINNCEGSVTLESKEGDVFNLKSPLCRFVALGRLLSECGDELELFCSLREDKEIFFEFFNKYPEILGYPTNNT